MRIVMFMLMTTALAGCAGNSAAPAVATVELAVVDDAEEDVQIVLSGAWLGNGNATWSRIAPETSEPLNGINATVPAGVYQVLRVVVANVTVDGEPAVLAENGFEMPLNVSLPADSVTQVVVGFSWPDALFRTNGELSFRPSLASLEVHRGGEPLLQLAAREIQSATKNPVARMEIYDANEARAFETDFLAESPKGYAIAAGPNVSFQASGSEAVEQGARLSSYAWDFGDGTTGEGLTVSHVYPLSGGKFTVRLTVTDSNGATDSQTVKLALVPGSLTAKQRFTGTATGVYPSSCSTSGNGNGMASHALPVDATQTPEGTPADLVRVQVNLFAVGNPHAAADLDLRVLDDAGESVGTSSSDGTTEEVSEGFEPGSAESGDWTVEVKPCLAHDVDYQVVGSLTWLAKEPEPGYLEWLSNYDDGHDHSH